ncbi:IS66 family transposase [Thiorhodovibrio litoralis]|uniref:IS66 family transposase n=1 Tax=Thiorhodovibrio litoralis TaxID=2952932 RepID=UPI002B260D4A|nr:transposase [Thiorhodovibrio litoralis]WPL11532.1 Transposase IS66 family protein [Thiorhodovibrio litoralis]
MPSVNKASLREEFASLKTQFEQVCAAGQVSAEVRTLFEALLVLFELLMAVFMEKTTTKTSRNSGVPPSQTDQDADPPNGSRSGSRAKGHDPSHNRSPNTRTIETVTTLPVKQCEHCAADLSQTPSQSHERRTRIDIVFEKTVDHLDAEIKDCPHCGQRTKAPFPASFAGPVQYGLGLRAYVINLLVAQMVSLQRVVQLLNTFIERVVSQATLLGYVMHLHVALARWEQEAIAALLKLPAIHVDETSIKVDRTNHWIHVYAGGQITLKFLHPKRGREAIEAINIIPRYGGITIHP